MPVAGVRTLGGKVETLEVDEPRPLAADEVLIDIRSAGVRNWDDIARTGGWDVGTSPPLALGVEAAGVIEAVGAHPSGFSVDDEVLCHHLRPRASRRRPRVQRSGHHERHLTTLPLHPEKTSHHKGVWR